ncbi:MAG: bifunctional folylpolyglutamate synthase/dihydrofolate synthase [Bacteroidia bacterium]
MYQRIGKSAFKKDLTNIIKLCEALDNPQNKFRSIHVAGTNGKGSTSHILSSIYQSNGYKVGLYTSPHLVDFRERIKVNGELCSKEFVTNFVAKTSHLIESIQPSFFEITVAMAFTYFADNKVDIAIIETGLGGRLDSTNIINPLASIITSIGYDHKDMLGDTLEQIAGEKAGIIKKKTPVVVGHIDKKPLEVIIEKANKEESPLSYYDDKGFETDLAGIHQQWNIGTALRCVKILDHILPAEKAKIDNGIQTVRTTSNFFGRWQIISDHPRVICDVGHNEEGFSLIAKQIKDLGLKPYYVLGFVKGKEVSSISPFLPKGEAYHFVKPNVIRGMDADEANELFDVKSGVSHSTLENALEKVYKQVQDNEDESFIFVGGSNFIVADLLKLKQEDKLPWNK